MSQASARHSPPPIAGPLTAAITGWCSPRSASTTSSSISIARSATVACGETGDVGHPAALAALVGAGAEAAPRPREYDGPHVVVLGDLTQPFAQRHHHVERHRVHPLGIVQRQQRDTGRRMVEQHVIHARQYVGLASRRDRVRKQRRRRPGPGGPDLRRVRNCGSVALQQDADAGASRAVPVGGGGQPALGTGRRPVRCCRRAGRWRGRYRCRRRSRAVGRSTPAGAAQAVDGVGPVGPVAHQPVGARRSR